MGEHASWITQFVNHYFGSAALALLSALHIRPTNPELPIPEHVVMGLLVLLVGTIFALWVRFRLSVERPGASQQVDRKSTRLNSSHQIISYAVFCLKKKKVSGTMPHRMTAA